ncbi:hypothetical protein TIFTF001_020471 [Ficus carica]|uniref:Uncharacterized protein n=1 Tax=Ficus carica TaxID=3494 RepID=A0AA88ADS4_FICCA|nr:hypothetical protein TIFTF001_020471 [Ficus carica]
MDGSVAGLVSWLAPPGLVSGWVSGWLVRRKKMSFYGAEEEWRLVGFAGANLFIVKKYCSKITKMSQTLHHKTKEK